MDLAHNGSVLNQDPVDAIAELLDRAKRGDITGITYAILTKEDEFEIGFAGTALKEPLRTLGVLGFMRIEFAEVVRRKLRIIKK